MSGLLLLLARHGQTADNADELILSRRDPPLSELGSQQAAQLGVAARARGVVAIWCSPLLQFVRPRPSPVRRSEWTRWSSRT